MLKILRSELYLAVLSCLMPLTAKAQITPDDSLGEESSVVTPLDAQGVAADVIDGGASRGTNLFHSFQDFNVDTGRSAFFSNPDGINNIFSRVTGTNISNINGLLGVLGGANLFLINPNGIIFGENAALNIQGSFFASTADSLLFDNNFEFSASNPQAPPLLEVSIPIGLNFRDNSGAIFNQSTSLDFNGNPVGLQVAPGQFLTLLGGDINFTGGNLTAPGGRVELGAVATAGMVTINEDASLSFPENLARGNINFNNGSRIIVNPLVSGNAGEIDITAGEIALDGVSILDASNLGTGEGDAGNISLQATGDISVVGSGILSNIGPEALGNVGEIVLEANSISMTESSQLQAGFFAGGQGNEITGKISLQANDSVSIDSSSIFANNEAGAIADTIDVEILANSIALENSSLFTTNDGVGDAGNVAIDAMNGRISLTNSIIFTDSTTGESGDINLAGRSLLLTDNSSLGGFSTQEAGAGNVTIQTTDYVTLDRGSSIAAFSSGRGAGGSVTVNSAQLNILNDSSISTFVFGDLPAGNIKINTTTVAINNDSSMLLDTIGNGDAGGLELNTGTLAITGGSVLSSSTSGGGRAGSFVINATDTIEITGTTADGLTASRIDASTSGSGAGGDIQVNANNLIIRDGSAISAFANSSGQGGNITVEVDDSIEISGFRPLGISRSSIDAQTVGTGNAGNISVNTSNLIISNGGEINATTIGEGSGGRLDILATDSITLSGFIPNSGFGSQITSQSLLEGGAAGDIALATSDLFVRDAGQINVSSFSTATAGNLEINADVIKLDNLGILNAQTFGGEGNIDIISQDIFLRGESNITTNSFGSSTGGNIIIDTENLVAFPNENSDISANAEDSFGGRVSITAKGIFGTEFREELTPQSDITATSQLGPNFSGEVSINTPEVDPTSGLIELPQAVGDASDQISQNPCEQGVGSEFIVTGKGGLPPNVNEALNSEEAQVSLIEAVPSQQQKTEANGVPTENPISEAVPAQGWVFNDKGEVTLTAYSTFDNEIQRSGKQHHNTCSSGIVP